MSTPSAARLLQAANWIIDHRQTETRGMWPRAAALLGRQALETAVKDRFPQLADAPGRARNICLPFLLDDADLGRQLSMSWTALSHATHHHAYDLPPTAEELKHWLQPVAQLVTANAAGPMT